MQFLICRFIHFVRLFTFDFRLRNISRRQSQIRIDRRSNLFTGKHLGKSICITIWGNCVLVMNIGCHLSAWQSIFIFIFLSIFLSSRSHFFPFFVISFLIDLYYYMEHAIQKWLLNKRTTVRVHDDPLAWPR